MLVNEHSKKQGKRAVLFSFLFFSLLFKSQTFIRNSDDKIFENITVLHEQKNVEIDKSNFKNFPFDTNDKIVYNGKLLDFSISHDTLYFFDKVKEIEEVHISGDNLNNKKERTINGNELKRYSAAIFPNNLVATFIQVDVKKKTFVKSITFFPEPSSFPNDINGSIEIQILPNVNGFPDNDNPILSFQKDISETVQKKWDIILPQIIKYPENGFFVTFFYKSVDKRRTAILKLNKDTYSYFYYPQSKEWKMATFNGYLYKLRILQ